MNTDTPLRRTTPLAWFLSLGLLFSSAACLGSNDDTPYALLGGVVTGPDGVGVANCTVMAIPTDTGSLETRRPRATTTTNENGGFRFEHLPPGEYGLSTRAPNLPAAYRGDLSLPPGETLEGVELQVGGQAVAVSGSIRDSQGNPIAGATVLILRRVGESLQLFFAGVSAPSEHFIVLAPGSYALVAEAPGFVRGIRHTSVSGDLTIDFELLSSQGLDSPPPREFTDWLRQSAIPLDSVEAGRGFCDLQPLKKTFGGARIVGLGEATHGTREFFQLKHRIFEFLAEEMGFTVFAIEANFTDALAINEYVQGGPAEPGALLKILGYWIWDTREVLDLIRWMRHYNEDPSHEEKLKFYGFDLQPQTRSMRAVLEYLERVDPETAGWAAENFRPLQDPDASDGSIEDTYQETTEALEDLGVRVAENKGRYIAASSAEEWEVTKHQLEIARWGHVRERSPAGPYGQRDEAMAENVRWITEREAPAKLVLWAHNSHVALGGTGPGAATMGSHIRRVFGDEYVSCGLFFSHGSFRALGGRRQRNFAVAPAPQGALEYALASAGESILALDLRQAPEVGVVAEWLGAIHPARRIGSVYDPSNPDAYFRPPIAPREEFDVLFFVRSTRATRGNALRRLGKIRSLPKAFSPVNLDLEEGHLGEVPVGWIINDWSRRNGYHTELTDTSVNSGQRSAMVSSSSVVTPGGFGVLWQSIEGEPFRGRRLRFRAAVRADVEGHGNQAQLWLRVDRRNQEVGFFYNMRDRPIVRNEWHFYEIIGDIDQDADAINYGILLMGQGKAFLDSVTLEAVED